MSSFGALLADRLDRHNETVRVVARPVAWVQERLGVHRLRLVG